jgi:hypothetical protein
MWKLEAGERVARWRAFRIEISGVPLERALQQTAELWQNCPHSPYYLDPNDPQSWPTAWDLITENYYCDIAKALGIVYTIAFSEHSRNLPMELAIYTDPSTGYDYNLSIFAEGKYVINFMDGEIVNIDSVKEKFKLKRCYDSTLLKLK